MPRLFHKSRPPLFPEASALPITRADIVAEIARLEPKLSARIELEEHLNAQVVALGGKVTTRHTPQVIALQLRLSLLKSGLETMPEEASA